MIRSIIPAPIPNMVGQEVPDSGKEGSPLAPGDAWARDVLVEVGVGVAVADADADGEGEADAVGVGVGEEDPLGVAVAVPVGVGVADPEGVGVGLGLSPVSVKVNWVQDAGGAALGSLVGAVGATGCCLSW